MKILLDTHIFYWLVTDLSRLGPVLRRELDDTANEIYFSAVVSWEIAAKRAKGKLHFTGSPWEWARRTGLTVLPIEPVHAETAADLPTWHLDPFDRLLIAQADTERLLLATADPIMDRYGVTVLRNV